MSREWHPNFSKYADYISNHENYKGLYIDQTASNPKWVETGKSDFGQLRKAWWNEQCKKMGLR